MILISGAAGKTGQSLIKSLKIKGQNVRAFVKNIKQKVIVENLGVNECFIGDIRDKNDFIEAAAGIRKIYHICPNVHPDEVMIGENMITAAKNANVDGIVYHSVLHPQIEDMPHHWLKMRVEEKILSSGIPFTILQPTAYMQNILSQKKNILESKVYEVPYSIHTKTSMVDLIEIAEIASKVLIESNHEGAIYELVGPEILSHFEIANLISEITKININAREIKKSDWEKKAKLSGLGHYKIEALLKMFVYYDKFSLLGNSNVLQLILEKEPIKIREFIEREF